MNVNAQKYLPTCVGDEYRSYDKQLNQDPRANIW